MIPVKILKEPVYQRGRSRNSVYPSSFDNGPGDIRHPLEPTSSLDDLSNCSLENDHEREELPFKNSQPTIINVEVKSNDNKGVKVKR